MKDLEQQIDEILKDYRQALNQQMGLILQGRHRLDIKTADKMLHEEPKAKLLTLIQQLDKSAVKEFIEDAQPLKDFEGKDINETWVVDVTADRLVSLKEREKRCKKN